MSPQDFFTLIYFEQAGGSRRLDEHCDYFNFYLVTSRPVDTTTGMLSGQVLLMVPRLLGALCKRKSSSVSDCLDCKRLLPGMFIGGVSRQFDGIRSLGESATHKAP